MLQIAFLPSCRHLVAALTAASATTIGGGVLVRRMPRWSRGLATRTFSSSSSNNNNDNNSNNSNSSGNNSTSNSSGNNSTSNSNSYSSSSSNVGNKGGSDSDSDSDLDSGSFFDKARRLRQEWKEMSKASQPMPDAPGDIPFISPLTMLRTVPLKLQMQAARDAWKLYKLGRNPFDSRSKDVYINVALAEEATIEELKDRYRKQLLREYEDDMKKKYGADYSLNLEAEAKKAKDKEEMQNAKIKEIDRQLDEISNEIIHNSKQLFGTLFKSSDGNLGNNKAVNLRMFIEERLMIMNEALADLQEGYLEGKKSSLEGVLNNDKYLEELENAVSEVRQKAESFIKASPVAEAVGKLYQQEVSNINRSSTSSGSSGSSSTSSGSGSRDGSIGEETRSTATANISSGSASSVGIGDETPVFASQESQDLYNKILAAKKMAKEALKAPINRVEDLMEEDKRRKQELARAASLKADLLLEKYKTGELVGGSELDRIIAEEESKVTEDVERMDRVISKTDEDMARKLEELSLIIGKKKEKLKGQYQTFQSGFKSEIDDAKRSAAGRGGGKDGIQSYINYGVNRIAQNIPATATTATSNVETNTPLPVPPVSASVDDNTNEKNLEKIDKYMGARVEEMGEKFKSKLKARFSSIFSNADRSTSHIEEKNRATPTGDPDGAATATTTASGSGNSTSTIENENKTAK